MSDSQQGTEIKIKEGSHQTFKCPGSHFSQRGRGLPQWLQILSLCTLRAIRATIRDQCTGQDFYCPSQLPKVAQAALGTHKAACQGGWHFGVAERMWRWKSHSRYHAVSWNWLNLTTIYCPSFPLEVAWLQSSKIVSYTGEILSVQLLSKWEHRFLCSLFCRLPRILTVTLVFNNTSLSGKKLQLWTNPVPLLLLVCNQAVESTRENHFPGYISNHHKLMVTKPNWNLPNANQPFSKELYPLHLSLSLFPF